MTATQRLTELVSSEELDTWVDGATPRAAPHDVEGFQRVLEWARAEGGRVLLEGTGTKRDGGPPPGPVDLVLSTQRWSGVVAHEPEDGTLTARAGTPWHELVERAAGGQHHLSPELPHDLGTLGGVLAAGQSGFDRLRHGPLRHQVLGTTVLLTDGRVAKSGGRLVKNVTGYDLHRLYCGSQGSLCLILEASLRLYPLPERSVVLRAAFPRRDEALEAARALERLPIQPVALRLDDLRGAGSERPWTVALVLAGRASVVAWEEEQSAAVDVRWERDEGSEARRAERDLERADGRWPDLVLTSRPSRVPAVLAALDRALETAGQEARLALHPGLAVTRAWLAGDVPDATRRTLAEALSPAPCTVRWDQAPSAEDDAPDAPSSVRGRLERSLRDALDPDHLLVARRHGLR